MKSRGTPLLPSLEFPLTFSMDRIQLRLSSNRSRRHLHSCTLHRTRRTPSSVNPRAHSDRPLRFPTQYDSRTRQTHLHRSTIRFLLPNSEPESTGRREKRILPPSPLSSRNNPTSSSSSSRNLPRLRNAHQHSSHFVYPSSSAYWTESRFDDWIRSYARSTFGRESV